MYKYDSCSAFDTWVDVNYDALVEMFEEQGAFNFDAFYWTVWEHRNEEIY